MDAELVCSAREEGNLLTKLETELNKLNKLSEKLSNLESASIMHTLWAGSCFLASFA